MHRVANCALVWIHQVLSATQRRYPASGPIRWQPCRRLHVWIRRLDGRMLPDDGREDSTTIPQSQHAGFSLGLARSHDRLRFGYVPDVPESSECFLSLPRHSYRNSNSRLHVAAFSAIFASDDVPHADARTPPSPPGADLLRGRGRSGHVDHMNYLGLPLR